MIHVSPFFARGTGEALRLMGEAGGPRQPEGKDKTMKNTKNMTSYEAGKQQAQFAKEQGWNPGPIENGGVRGEADSIAECYRDENGSLDGYSRREAIAGWNDAL